MEQALDPCAALAHSLPLGASVLSRECVGQGRCRRGGAKGLCPNNNKTTTADSFSLCARPWDALSPCSPTDLTREVLSQAWSSKPGLRPLLLFQVAVALARLPHLSEPLFPHRYCEEPDSTQVSRVR